MLGGSLPLSRSQPSVAQAEEAAEGGGTRLRVVETGLEQMGWSDEQQDTYVREHNFGWVTYLGRLRDYLGRQHAGQMP
jgi:hypothetical protein